MRSLQEQTDSKEPPRSSSLLLLVEKIPAVLWTTDTALRFTSMAGAGLALMSGERNGYLGAPLTDFFPQAGADEYAPCRSPASSSGPCREI